MTTEDVVDAPTSAPTAADAAASVLLPPNPLPDSFDSLGLDARLLRGLGKMGIRKPTAVQAVTIPAALEGRDVVARARTGSGKTLAFLLPAFHAVARFTSSVAGGASNNSPREAARPWRALVLVPTRELAEQVADVADELARSSGLHVRTSTLAAVASASPSATPTPSSSSPRECQPSRCGQLVVSTPGRLAQALASLGGKSGKSSSSSSSPSDASSLLENLAVVAVDEADLLLSLPGYQSDLARVGSLLPRGAQRMLLSATSAAAVDELGSLMLQDPVRVDATRGGEGEASGDSRADGGDPSRLQPPLSGVASTVSHYYLESADGSDAAMLSALIALLKLGAAKRRVLVFAPSDDEGVKLKLALAAFGVKAARLGAALPLNSRHHALQEFNRGVYDCLIATDDGRGDASCTSREEEGEVEERDERKSKKAKASDAKKKSKNDDDERREFGVVRGIDFSGVRTVVNYGPPRSATSYVHRAGRTGRAGAKGAVVTLFARGKKNGEGESERAALEASLVETSSSSSEPFRLLPYPRLPPSAASALRYRVEDVARALTRPALREARAQELRRELLNSQRLSAHFALAPRDLALLRHDAPLSAAGRAAAAGGGGLLGSGGGGGSSHLKRLPSYLMNAAGLRGKRAAAAAAAAAGSGSKKANNSKKRTRDDGDPLRGLASGPATPALKAAFLSRSTSGRDEFDEMTPLEKRAQAEGERAAKKAAKKSAPLAKVAAAARERQNAVAKGKHRRR